jgi:cellulose biosynthesis protein BcsQ
VAGTTSITAALAWALQLLGETVLAIDASPDNMLRFFSTLMPSSRRLGAGAARRPGLA